MEATRDSIAAALGRPGDLTLDCTDVTAADVSFVQVLLAARRSAAEARRSLVLHRPPAGALLETLRRGGFLAADGPPPSCDPGAWPTPGQAAR